MSEIRDRIISHLFAICETVRMLRTEVELLDGSDPRDRERRGTVRAFVGVVEPSPKKFCVNCKHFRHTPNPGTFELKYACNGDLDPVTGRPRWVSCCDSRKVGCNCGPDGKLFEAAK